MGVCAVIGGATLGTAGWQSVTSNEQIFKERRAYDSARAEALELAYKIAKTIGEENFSERSFDAFVAQHVRENRRSHLKNLQFTEQEVAEWLGTRRIPLTILRTVLAILIGLSGASLGAVVSKWTMIEISKKKKMRSENATAKEVLRKACYDRVERK